jgi:pyrrolidone-carboxylate peptidase
MAEQRMTARRLGVLGASAGAAFALVFTSLPLTGATASVTARPAAPCLTHEGTLTVEEERVGQPLTAGGQSAATRFVRAAGFREFGAPFYRDLCAAKTLDEVEALVTERGQQLWDLAVARAQGERAIGRIDRYDDRPLYWARLQMTKALRLYDAPFELSGIQRAALVRMLDYSSRGIDSIEWSAAEGDAKRVMISGFDTYSLDTSLRNSNPSGATALQLDGKTIQTDQGPVVVEAVVFPVNYTDFDQGIVEDAFGQVLRTGENRADLIMTISQTGRGKMDIEQWAANARGGFPDNNRNMQFGPISRPSHWPQPFDSPNWIETTLPYEAMIEAGTGPWPVVLNDGICEWPAGEFPDPSAVRCQDDPSEGSTAASGPGGSYLSNESMYRTNRLRQGLQAWDVPGGHLHISSLIYPENLSALTSPAFEADRKAVVDQTVALVTAAGAAARS